MHHSVKDECKQMLNRLFCASDARRLSRGIDLMSEEQVASVLERLVHAEMCARTALLELDQLTCKSKTTS